MCLVLFVYIFARSQLHRVVGPYKLLDGVSNY
jgi:hypothetical protein